MKKRRSLLCKLGFHSANKDMHYERSHHKNNIITSRSAFCKRCDKKLYLVDKCGNRKQSKNS